MILFAAAVMTNTALLRPIRPMTMLPMRSFREMMRVGCLPR